MDFNQYILELAIYLHDNYGWIKLASVTSMLFIGILGLSPLNVKQDEASTLVRMGAFYRKVTISVFMFTLVTFAFIHYSLQYYGFGGFHPNWVFWVFLTTIYILGKMGSLANHRIIMPHISNLKEKYRVSQTGDNSSDIRVDNQNKLLPVSFKPTKHYKLNDGLFFEGLDVKGKPIYSTIQDWMMNNKASIGPTQIGKGVDIGVQLDQSIRLGCITIFIDPKPDKFARTIMINACRETNRKLIEIDLTGEWESQDYALLATGTLREKKTRLIRLLNLENTGTDADFFKTKDRSDLDKLLNVNASSFADLKVMIEEVYNDSDGKNMNGTYSYVSELAQLASVNDEGINIEEDVFSGNNVLYVRCSTTDSAVIKLAIALIEDIIQTVFRTSPEKGGNRDKHVFLLVDELRFMLNAYIADSLATLKSDNAHMYIAFQSFEDTRNVKDKAIDKDSLQESIFTNCTYKLIYRADNKNQADWASEQTGTITKKVTDRVNTKINKYGGEEQDGGRSIVNLEENLITANQFMMLDTRVGVLKRPAELAQIIKTCWVEADVTANIPRKRVIAEIKPKVNIREENKKRKKSAQKNMDEQISINDMFHSDELEAPVDDTMEKLKRVHKKKG